MLEILMQELDNYNSDISGIFGLKQVNI